jgi:hypothetical protein
MIRAEPEFNQSMPALNESTTGTSLKLFMTELLQDHQRILRRDSDDVILLPDNSKSLPSNASQISRDSTIPPTSTTSFPEGMGGFASPKKTQSRWSASSIRSGASLVTSTSRWDTSSPKVPKDTSTSFSTEGMGGFASPKKTQSRWSADSSSIHKDASFTATCRCFDSSPTPPTRLPEEHNDQKFRRGHRFNSCSDESFTNQSLKTSSQDIERGRGFSLPSSLLRLPYKYGDCRSKSLQEYLSRSTNQ